MKARLLFFLIIASSSMFSQENKLVTDSISSEKKKKLELNVDVVSRYIWRGQSWGGNYVAVQPSIGYDITPKLNLLVWASTNFKNEYFYADGTSYKGYQEIDFSVSYQINDFLQFQVWDYYWPSVKKVEGVDNSFFNYGKDGVKTIDAIMYFDFSEGYKYPFTATISTLVAGNDYRYDTNGENPKQNFTTYLELSYKFTFFEKSSLKPIQNIEIQPFLGAVLNNKSGYYSNADYDKVSFVNMSIEATKEFDLGKGMKMPVFLNYSHNGATKNTEVFGKDFLIAGISFNY